MAKRREVNLGLKCGWGSSGIDVRVNRKGIDISGWYDSIVGLEGPSLTWAQIDEAREQVNRKGSE